MLNVVRVLMKQLSRNISGVFGWLSIEFVKKLLLIARHVELIHVYMGAESWGTLEVT